MPRLRSTVRLIGWILLALVVLAALLVGAALWEVHRSVPTLDGRVRVPGLQADVAISRDALGTAVVKGANRLDVARGLGFVHAQERFFEMDLTRRSAAGELSALFGTLALERDKLRRMHRTRAMLTARLAQMDVGERALLQAYADGVNAGLGQLRTRPWQYRLLRAEPERWQPVDSLLVVAEMFWMLQGNSVQEGLARAQLRECVGDTAFDWLEPRGGRWDAALDGSVLQPGAMPGPEVLDLRKPAPATPAASAASVVARASIFLDDMAAPDRHEAWVGSNNWAVSGARSVSGDAMLANDMHLSLGVPAIWFRTQFEIGGERPIRAEGVTLPGVPAMVVGSNGHVAWGFTNSYGQWFDWIDVTPWVKRSDPHLVKNVSETIVVKGGADAKLAITLFDGMPVVHRRPSNLAQFELDGDRIYALDWVGDSGAAYNLMLDRLLTANTVPAALDIASRSGIPEQNFTVADSGGHVGWTIAGAGFVTQPGAKPYRTAEILDGSGRFVMPRLEDPAGGLVWTANQRTYSQPAVSLSAIPRTPDESPGSAPVGLDTPAPGQEIEEIGDGGYDLGARAQQVRDRLAATPKFDEKTLAAIQFDDEARFLRPWAGRIAAVSGQRPEVARLLAGWNGRADADQAGYRLLRETRKRVLDALWAAWVPALAMAHGCDGRDFEWHARFEYAAEQALDDKPPHLLPRGFASWDAFLLAQVDATADDMTGHGARALPQATWGEKNASRIGHPLARALPVLSRWLDMPAVPQAGDGNMPRVAAPGFGQSERLVVAPGHEERATLSMSGGQSGHPMSPYFGAGHEDWVAGRATPLLAGPAEHVLTLTP